MRIKTNDTVKVITGDDRGTTGKVLRVERKAGKLVVEGVNRVYKHVRRSQKNPQGGRLSKEMPVRVSNRALGPAACRASTSSSNVLPYISLAAFLTSSVVGLLVTRT